MSILARDGFVGESLVIDSENECLAVVDGVCVTQQMIDAAVAKLQENQKQFNPAKYALGTVCKRGHTWFDTGKCLRRLCNGEPHGCVFCRMDQPDYKGGKLKIDRLQWENLAMIGDRFCLEELCVNEHNFLSTGFSLRYANDVKHYCFQCTQQKQSKHRAKNKDKINSKKREKRRNSERVSVLGKLCRRNHSHEDSEMSLRNGKGECIQCITENAIKHRQINKQKAGRVIGATELGSLCKRGHDFEGTGLSLRKVKNQVCVECSKIHQLTGYRRNPDKMVHHNRKRRAAKMAKLVKPYSLDNIQSLLAKFEFCCAYCQKKFPELGKRRYAIDHVIPLAMQGEDSLSNIVPSCQSCNSSKNDNEPYEWFSRQLFFSGERWLFIQSVLMQTQTAVPQGGKTNDSRF